jgi:hypothetical protein
MKISSAPGGILEQKRGGPLLRAIKHSPLVFPGKLITVYKCNFTNTTRERGFKGISPGGFPRFFSPKGPLTLGNCPLKC